MKLRPKFDREFLSVTNGQNYVTYGKNFLWNSKKIFPVNYMEMAVTYGEKSFMEQTPGDLVAFVTHLQQEGKVQLQV